VDGKAVDRILVKDPQRAFVPLTARRAFHSDRRMVQMRYRNPVSVSGRPVSRRQAMAIGSGLAAAVGLAACSNSDEPTASSTTTGTESTSGPLSGASPTSAGTAGAASASSSRASASGLPSYTPYAGVTPDMPATADGVSAAFLKYPSPPVQMHSGVPGKGGEVTSFTQFYAALATPLDSNPYWRQFNKMLGVKWKPTIAGDDFQAKLATMIAGNDLPDLTMIPLAGVPNLIDVLQHVFVDLTPYLGDDAVKAYPALAGFAPAAWTASTVNGFLAGIPLPREQVKWVMMVREDYREALGVTGEVATKEDFVSLCQALTDVKKNRYALGYPAAAWDFIQEVFRVPNGWVEADGKFTSAYETDEMKGAIGWFNTLVKQKCFNPDAFAASGSTINSWLYNGTVALRMGPPAVWYSSLPRMTDPKAKFSLIKPPSDNGQPGRQLLGPGTTQTVTGISKKASESRVKELLTLIDWLASPFGTKERQFFSYGIEGHDFNFVNGDPQLISAVSDQELNVAPKVADPVQVIYAPGQPDITTAIYQYEKDMVPGGASDPTWSLYAPTASAKQASLDKTMGDLVNDIAQGRKSLSDWDSAVKSWRSKGGDTIRQEYQDAFAKAN
jgi:putative aldouronate transport system substrate-binding protein